MRSAIVSKSVTEFTRRRLRSLLAATSLAIAVASIGVFALPPLVDRAMQREVTASRLADVTLWTPSLRLGAADLARLRALPNVRAVQPRSSFSTRVYVGDRRKSALVIGVPDFARQSVDVVHLESGAPPADGALLTETQDRKGGYTAGAGDSARVVAAKGQVRRLPIVGVGRNLGQGQDVVFESRLVLYATPATVSALSGEDGFSALLLRLEDHSDAAVRATIARVRAQLRTIAPGATFTNLPEVRAPGDWPGRAQLDQFSKLFSIVTVLALLSALVLVANTMTTLVGEQTAEIGTMKAIGARRRQVARIYLTTALLLGAAGAVAGGLLGVALSNGLARFFGTTFFAIDPPFAVHVPILVVSVVVGLLLPPLAALPAVRRATGLSVREAFEASQAPLGADGAVERALRRVRFLPRTAQIGLRSVARRKRRAVSTALIVAVAVGNLLAVLAFATAVGDTTRGEWGSHREDVRLWTSGRNGFTPAAQRLIRTDPGVARAQPALVNDVRIAGRDAFVWAVPRDTLFDYSLSAGRWFTGQEERDRARVAVLESSIARQAGVHAGDRVSFDTAAGPARFRVVGISSNQQENGFVAFGPLTTVRSVLRSPDRVDSFWIKTTSSEHAFVDRTTTRLEDALIARGYEPGSEITYVARADNIALNETLTTSIAVLGFVVIAISLVGLVNAITMSMLERTREVGILRSIGARARDVRRIFSAEGVTLALLGWAVGIPLGYALDRGLVWLLRQSLDVDVGVVYPARNILVVLAGTVVLTLVILRIPIRRAVRLRPGDALHYG